MLHLTDNAKHLLQTRYYISGETWEDLVERVVTHAVPKLSAGKVAKTKQTMYRTHISEGNFIPSRMPYMGTSKPFSSSCFVLGPIEDSRESIFSILRDMAEVQAYGGGCIGGESVVLTNRGPVAMKELVEKQDSDTKVLSYNPETQETEFATVSKWHTVPTDLGRVYRINFAHGIRSIANSMRTSDWHPFFVFDGEKVVEVRADELKPGMAVIGSSEYRRGYDDWGWLLGYIAGDGAIDYNREPKYPRVRIVDNNEDAVKRAAEIIGVKYSKAPDHRYEVDMWLLETTGETAAKVRDAFDGYKGCYEKRVPEGIWEASPERKFSFIVGHLDADGWYSAEKKRFVAATVSEGLANDLLALAGSLGIRAKLRERKPRRPNESTIWHITYMPSKRLIEEIVSVSAKYGEKEVAKWTKGAINLSPLWRERLEKHGIKLGKPAWRDRTEIQGKMHSLINWLQTGRATRDVAADIVEACGERNLAQAIRSAQIVHSTEQLSEGETLYDLTVPGNQTYLASSPGIGAFVVVHNTGYDFSRLRPEGDLISTTRGKASGPVSFMQLYNAVTKCITRNGNKGGAQMGVLNISHPDIQRFITMKDRETDMTNFNISVSITDAFMEAVKEDTLWQLIFNGQVYAEIPARELFRQIAQHAWANGEPGAIYIDTINRFNPFDEPLYATNACAENPLPNYGSCNLGSVNLKQMLNEDGTLNEELLKDTVTAGIWFLNDSINHAWWPTEKLREVTLKYRNIGLGVMGFADMLALMDIPYASHEAWVFARYLSERIRQHADEASAEYARKHGTRPNTTVLSIAPTGSIGILANVNNAIEPFFGLAYTKNTTLGQLKEINPTFEVVLQQKSLYSEEIMEQVAREGTVANTSLPDDIKELFRLGTEMPWEVHVAMQAIWQRSVDAAVSKTINLPNSATVEDVENAFMYAWEQGCKSTTVYRDGSRSVQAVVAGTEKNVAGLAELGVQILTEESLGDPTDCLTCTL